MQGDEAEKRREFFFGWKRKGSDATYERLLKIHGVGWMQRASASYCRSHATPGQDHVWVGGGGGHLSPSMPPSPPCRLVPLQTIV